MSLLLSHPCPPFSGGHGGLGRLRGCPELHSLEVPEPGLECQHSPLNSMLFSGGFVLLGESSEGLGSRKKMEDGAEGVIVLRQVLGHVNVQTHRLSPDSSLTLLSQGPHFDSYSWEQWWDQLLTPPNGESFHSFPNSPPSCPGGN